MASSVCCLSFAAETKTYIVHMTKILRKTKVHECNVKQNNTMSSRPQTTRSGRYPGNMMWRGKEQRNGRRGTRIDWWQRHASRASGVPISGLLNSFGKLTIASVLDGCRPSEERENTPRGTSFQTKPRWQQSEHQLPNDASVNSHKICRLCGRFVHVRSS